MQLGNNLIINIEKALDFEPSREIDFVWIINHIYWVPTTCIALDLYLTFLVLRESLPLRCI